MIIVTGAAGFIGSCVVKELNNQNIKDIIIVDNLGKSNKWKNLVNLQYEQFIHKNNFLEYLTTLDVKQSKKIELIIHLGACSSTTENDADYLMDNNALYTKKIYEWCNKNNCRMIYASSAAVYGDGELGYSDNKTDEYLPLNMYGYSKKLFDQYTLMSKKNNLKQCVGLRFFNVYGPNEYHKGNMASVIYHSFNQIKKDSKVKLFKSYKKGYANGEQSRDFVYVKDCISVIMHMIKNPKISGIFNVGTGKSRTYKDLVTGTFNAMNIKANIEFIDMPEGLAAKYQYFTQADISKLRKIGYKKEFYSLEEGITDYVKNYLMKEYKHAD